MAGFIRHYQMNHEEGGAKRGRGFQEAIWQLSKLLILKHEKNLCGKEHLRMISNLNWLSTCHNNLDLYPFSKSAELERYFLGSFFLLKRAVACHRILSNKALFQ